MSSKISPQQAAEIQGRNLSDEFEFAKNSPYPKSMDAVRSFEEVGTRMYGAPGPGKDPSVWVGIYVKQGAEPAPVAA